MRSVSDFKLRVIAALAASTGIAALLLDVYDVIAMPFTLSFVAIPVTIALVAFSAMVNRVDRADFVRRMWIGFVAGLLATAAYDISRWLVLVLTPATFDPFRALPNFGALMLDQPASTTGAVVAGWIYHFWNGLSFAVIYTLLAGGARARWAVGWAFLLEVATIIVTPRYTGISPTDTAFIAVSLIGHIIYGATLGVLARSWLPGDGQRLLRLGPVKLKGEVW